jgi:predicted Zn finger-like uncharacterized protein
MRFACDACGKKYSTSDEPAPGKIYKLRCKACGHVIVVRAQAGTSTALPLAAPGGPGEVAAGGAPASHASEPTEEGAVLDELPPLPPLTAAGGGPEPGPRAGGSGSGGPAGGYVELFGDGTTDRHLVGRVGERLAEAARASLPEGSLAGGAQDPLAPRVAGPASPPRPEPGPGPPPRPAPAPPGAPRRSHMGAVIALGVAALVAITAVALLRTGRKAQAPPPATPPAAPAPATPSARVEEPAPAPPPAAEPAPRDEAEKKPGRPRPAERKAEPRPAAAAEAPRPAAEERTESREVRLTDAESALPPEVVQRVVNANRKAFAACIAAAESSGVRLDGRKVALRLTVVPAGTVTYPTLDDVTLNSTEMGQCLKNSARLMIFPKFKGDPIHLEVPLQLSP